jgi:hypothetical protein
MSILEKEDELKNILFILKSSRKALKNKNSFLLKELSNKTIHGASIYQDPDSIAIAVTIYTLSKIIERGDYMTMKGWKQFYDDVIFNIDESIKDLQINDFVKFREDLYAIRADVDKLSGHLKRYIQDVFNRASITKASRIYEHGISFSETANVLGISQWELAEYIGRTGIGDVDLSITMPIKERLKFTEDLFK